MRAGTEQEKKTGLIAWNGIRLSTPKAWDARVSGQCHLVFEKDFRPLLQIRWERSAHHPSSNLKKIIMNCAAESGSVITEDSLPEDLQALRDNFDQVSCYREESGMMQAGICLSADCRTLVLFQILTVDPALLNEVSACLSTLSCCNHTENLWRIQKFTLRLPVSYTLKDYAFAAGLTRLSFLSSDLSLQTCTLGPADIRLNRQSLEEILVTLTGSPHLQIVTGKDGTSCAGSRGPTIAQQIIFRLRRDKPFIRAAIRHDIGTNQLLAVVLSANRPIDPTTLHEIFQEYEIIQE